MRIFFLYFSFLVEFSKSVCWNVPSFFKSGPFGLVTHLNPPKGINHEGFVATSMLITTALLLCDLRAVYMRRASGSHSRSSNTSSHSFGTVCLYTAAAAAAERLWHIYYMHEAFYIRIVYPPRSHTTSTHTQSSPSIQRCHLPWPGTSVRQWVVIGREQQQRAVIMFDAHSEEPAQGEQEEQQYQYGWGISGHTEVKRGRLQARRVCHWAPRS